MSNFFGIFSENVTKITENVINTIEDCKKFVSQKIQSSEGADKSTNLFSDIDKTITTLAYANDAQAIHTALEFEKNKLLETGNILKDAIEKDFVSAKKKAFKKLVDSDPSSEKSKEFYEESRVIFDKYYDNETEKQKKIETANQVFEYAHNNNIPHKLEQSTKKGTLAGIATNIPTIATGGHNQVKKMSEATNEVSSGLYNIYLMITNPEVRMGLSDAIDEKAAKEQSIADLLKSSTPKSPTQPPQSSQSFVSSINHRPGGSSNFR